MSAQRIHKKEEGQCASGTAPVMTIQQAAEKWVLTSRRVSKLCQDGRVPGAYKPAGSFWLIPSNAKKPEDGRLLRSRLKKEAEKESKGNG